MNKLINALNIIGICGLLACHSKPSAKKESGKLSPISNQTVTKQKPGNKHQHVAQLTFMEYLDDGDYFQILAKRGDSTYSFINKANSSRNLNRGDQIQVVWKNGTVTIAGDQDAEMPAKLILSIKKTRESPVTAFRNTYGKKIKYTWSTDEEFTSSYLDKIYLLTEYYLTQTKNHLLQAAIKKRQELTYSIESKERNGQHYRVIGIAPVGPNGSHTVQWLYIGEESGQIYEYNLPDDKLVAFN